MGEETAQRVVGTREAAAEPRSGSRAGDLLLRPLVLAAIVVLVVNDWYLKHQWPGALTGKLSDCAGLIVFPVLVVALAELVAAAGGRSWRATPGAVAAVAITVGFAFAATKTIEPVRNADELALGWLRWLPFAAVRLASGEGAGSPVRHQVVADASDLVALPCTLAGLWIGGRRHAMATAGRISGSMSNLVELERRTR